MQERFRCSGGEHSELSLAEAPWGDSLFQRERLITLAVITTFLSLIPTTYVALISNSMTLYADLLRCVGEFVAIVVSLVVLKKASLNEGRLFNYGYGKMEQLAGVAVAGALFLSFLLSFVSGIHGLLVPSRVVNGEAGLALAILSVGGNAFMWFSNEVTHNRAPSPIANSQRRLFRAKTLASVVVALSICGSIYLPSGDLALMVDPLGAIAISLFMLRQSYTLTAASVPDLIDYALEAGLLRSLDSILADHASQYLKVERVRSRRAGRHCHIEVVIAFPPDIRLAELHTSMSQIRAAVEAGVPGAEVVIIPTTPNNL